MVLPAQHADHRGFTLLEVMVAVIIMSIGLLALLQTVNLAIASNRSNQLRNDAIIYADERVGIMRTRAFRNVFSNVTTQRHRVNLGFVNYSVVSDVSNLTTHRLVDDPSAGLVADQLAGSKNLFTRVTWREKGIKKTHSLATTIVESAN